jgi:hypothetical protein
MKNRETARMAGLWLLKVEDIYPKTRGPIIADDFPTSAKVPKYSLSLPCGINWAKNALLAA